jgi:plasmid stabilization system protein ParE
MNVIFHAAAQAELEEATRYYDGQRPGLGDDFADEVRRTLERIQQYPDAWTRLTDQVRRCRTNRFPYGVVYAVRDEEIFVLAVMHLRRKPGYWADRL